MTVVMRTTESQMKKEQHVFNKLKSIRDKCRLIKPTQVASPPISPLVTSKRMLYVQSPNRAIQVISGAKIELRELTES
jgi:hypothetical protein